MSHLSNTSLATLPPLGRDCEGMSDFLSERRLVVHHCFVDDALHDLREAESCPFTPPTQHHVVAACNLCVCMCMCGVRSVRSAWSVWCEVCGVRVRIVCICECECMCDGFECRELNTQRFTMSKTCGKRTWGWVDICRSASTCPRMSGLTCCERR